MFDGGRWVDIDLWIYLGAIYDVGYRVLVLKGFYFIIFKRGK